MCYLPVGGKAFDTRHIVIWGLAITVLSTYSG